MTEKLADELDYWVRVIGDRLGPGDRKFSDAAKEAAAALRRPPPPQQGRNAGLEEAARYHDQAAADCRAIARVNSDNSLGSDSATHAIDHEIAAEDIRAMKGTPAPAKDQS